MVSNSERRGSPEFTYFRIRTASVRVKINQARPLCRASSNMADSNFPALPPFFMSESVRFHLVLILVGPFRPSSHYFGPTFSKNYLLHSHNLSPFNYTVIISTLLFIRL